MSKFYRLDCIAVLALLALAGCRHQLTSSPESTLICPFEGTEMLFQVSGDSPSSQLVEEAIEVVWARLDSLGIDDASASRHEETQILVQLPPTSDPQRVAQVISSTAQLEFRPQRIGTEAQFVTEYTVYQDLLVKREQLQDSSNATAIAESQAAIEQSQAAIATLFESSELTGARVHDAYPQPLGDANKWEVVLTFDEEGTALFTDLTRNIAGTGRTLGIFLDEQLLSAPTVSVDYVETGITGGRASISGDFDARTATDLVVQLRSGSLPASLEMLEVATIKRDRNCKIGE